MYYKKMLLISTFVASFTTLTAHAAEPQKITLNDVEKKTLLAPYPESIAQLTRHVFFLEQKENENDYRVEILLGKTQLVDCNLQHFSGVVSEEVVEGWGYSYYKLDKVYGPASTLMACPDNSKKEKFIEVNYQNTLKRYNSRLPVVIYTPKDIEVKYRIWQAQPEITPSVSNNLTEQ